jgi:hypothetical protein
MSKLKIASAVRRERLSYEAFMARHRSDLKSAEFLFRDDLGSEYTLMGTSMAEMLAVAFCQPLLHQCMRELKNHPFIRVLRAARSENCPDAYTKLLFLWLCWMDVAPPEGISFERRGKLGRPRNQRTSMIYDRWLEIGQPPLGCKTLAQAVNGSGFTKANPKDRKRMVDQCRQAVERRQAQLRLNPKQISS